MAAAAQPIPPKPWNLEQYKTQFSKLEPQNKIQHLTSNFFTKTKRNQDGQDTETKLEGDELKYAQESIKRYQNYTKENQTQRFQAAKALQQAAAATKAQQEREAKQAKQAKQAQQARLAQQAAAVAKEDEQFFQNLMDSAQKLADLQGNLEIELNKLGSAPAALQQQINTIYAAPTSTASSTTTATIDAASASTTADPTIRRILKCMAYVIRVYRATTATATGSSTATAPATGAAGGV